MSTNHEVGDSILLCPADTPPHGHNGWNSYPGRVGYGYQAFGNNGIFTFAPAGPTSPRDVRDGMSHTIALGEWVIGKGGRKETEKPRAVLVTNPPREKPDQLDDFISACAATDLPSAPRASIGKGRNWMVGVLGSSLHNHTMPIGAQSCVNGGLVLQGAFTAGSLHGGWTSALFADGHATAFRDSTPLRIWQALSSRAGLEAVDDPRP